MKVRFSSEANRDIEEIANYIFDLNPEAAFRFLNAIEQTCSLLSKQPLIGRPRPTLGDNLRSHPIGNYLAFYVPAPEEVVIVRVIYGGRDLPGAFQK